MGSGSIPACSSSIEPRFAPRTSTLIRSSRHFGPGFCDWAELRERIASVSCCNGIPLPITSLGGGSTLSEMKIWSHS
jgi:hypothetical protein